MADWNWITARVAVGAEPSSSDIAVMRRQGITDVLDVRGEPHQGEMGPRPQMYAGTGVTYHYVPMLDRGGAQPVSVYQQGVLIMQQVLSDPNRKLLVQCAAGEYRSPSMVYAYLRSIGVAPQAAWAMITASRIHANLQYVDSAEASVPYLPHYVPSNASSNAAVFALVAVGLGVTAYGARQLWTRQPRTRRARRQLGYAGAAT